MPSDPVSVLDVAAYILRVKGSMSAMKLQKLAYYSQAWSLVWDEGPLFREPIQAWRDGPVAPALYSRHRGAFVIGQISEGNADALDMEQRQTVDAVLGQYGAYDGVTLSRMTHDEEPWREARSDLPEGENSEAVVTHESMARFYGSL